MKRVCSTMAILLLTGGIALAQAGGGGGAGGAGGGASTGAGGATGGGTAPSSRSGTISPTNPNGSSLPSTNGTVGQAPGLNPGNSQDQINRNNPQDLNKPGGTNPQDLKR